MPPAAIGELAAGLQSSAAAFAGDAPAAGSAVNNPVAGVVLFVRALAVMSSENWFAGVAVFAWNPMLFTSVRRMLRTWRSEFARSGVAALPARWNVSGSRRDTPPAGNRARMPLT